MKKLLAQLAGLSLFLLQGCRTAPGDITQPNPPLQQVGQQGIQQPALQTVSEQDRSTSHPPTDKDNLLLGNPSNARSSNTPNKDNLLVERPQHAMSYNAGAGGPNWVAWHLQMSDLGNMRRGTFRPDPLLPADLQIRPNDYRGSGYDRGHVCPSGDRTSTRENNDATFVMSNMLPQAPALNQHVWAKLEDYARSLVRRGNELYTIAGGMGTQGHIAGGKVNVPISCWKIILVLPQGDNDLARINAETRVITVLMPNQDTPEVSGARWSKYLTNVAALEKQTGYDFLSALPDDIERALEAKTDSGRASRDGEPDAEAADAGATRPGAASVAPAGGYRDGTGEAPSSPESEVTRAESEAQPGVGEQPAPDQQAATSGQVWVNTRSGVYHLPGTRWYGVTKQGEYMSEAQALAHGFHAAQNGQ